MSKDPNFTQIEDPKEQAALMARAMLDIQLAGYEPEENCFLAAHGAYDSILVARHTGEIMVWQVLNGTKEERKALAERVRQKLLATS